jgi:NADH-quinone oxidoreductase subunit N
MPDARTLLLILPELILALVGMLILLFDLILRERGQRLVAWLAFFGFAGALVATLVLFPAKTGSPIFAGTYVSDDFALFFKMVAAVSGIILTLVSVDYLRKHAAPQGEFFALFVFAVLAMMLMASSTNLLMIYLSIEFLSYMSYLLTGFLRDDKKSNEAAIKYFLYGAITSAVMLYGLSLLYGATGSLNLDEINRAFSVTSDNSLRHLALIALALVLAGLGFKISLVPFHQWAPDAYEGAPTPVTAFLSVGPKAAGFAVLLRLVLSGLPVFQDSWVALLSTISILTMTVGNLTALQQTNVKRMLAYSSIAQAGYMLIGLVAYSGVGNSPFTGINGVLIYLAAYLFTNLGAFICVIAIENATGAVDIADYAGLIKRAPFLAVMLVIFFLSLAGIPPTAGFIGKFFVFGAALRQNLLFLAAVGVVNSVISVFYYFSVVRASFMMEAKNAASIVTPIAAKFALAVCGIIVLAFSIVPQPFIDFAQMTTVMLGLK